MPARRRQKRSWKRTEEGSDPGVQRRDAIVELLNAEAAVHRPVVTKNLDDVARQLGCGTSQMRTRLLDPSSRGRHGEWNPPRQRQSACVAHDLEDAHLRRVLTAQQILRA